MSYLNRTDLEYNRYNIMKKYDLFSEWSKEKYIFFSVNPI